ncbi:MAG: small ribosomal subunit Rsm22 family protein [Myxococcota bacterium]
MTFEERLLEAVGEVGESRLGPSDPRALADAVADVSEAYTRRRDRLERLGGDARALAARLRFFLPRDLPKVQTPLEELQLAGGLPRGRHWRVLDLGAGLGTTTLGVARFAARTGTADRITAVAIDRDGRALALLRDLAARSERMGLVPIHVETHAGDLGSLRPSDLTGPFDLVLLGFVLNELTTAPPDDVRAVESLSRVLADWSRVLDEKGALLVLEPALRDTSRRLQAVRDRIVATPGPPHVFAPCLGVDACPMLATPRDWCHTDRPGPLPEPVAEIARGAGLRTERRTASHLTLRWLEGSLAAGAHGVPGTAYRVVSAPLRSKGKLEVVGCGTGGLVRLMRLDRHASPTNRALDAVHRGAVLSVDGGRPRGERLRIEAEDPVHPVGPDPKEGEG